jgi:hypothetical protein
MSPIKRRPLDFCPHYGYLTAIGDYAGLDSRGESLLWGKRPFWRFRRDRPLRSGDNKKAPVWGLVVACIAALLFFGFSDVGFGGVNRQRVAGCAVDTQYKAARPLLVENISEMESSEDDGRRQRWINLNIRDNPLSQTRRQMITEIDRSRIIRCSRDICFLAKANLNSEQFSRCFPVITNIQLEHSAFAIIGASAQNIGPFDKATVSDLPSSNAGQNDSSNEQKAGETGHGIVAHFLEVFFNIVPPWAVTAIIGALCGTVGIAIYLNFSGWRSALGFGLMALGLLTPIFPWWVFLLLPFEVG